MNAKKIVLMGTSCVGKTTLINNIRIMNIDGVVIVNEAARQYFIDHPMPDSERFTFATQCAIQDATIDYEKKLQKDSKARVIFCDNSVLLAAAFTSVGDGWEAAQKLVDRVAEWVDSYDKIYVVDPADVPYQMDDVRTESIHQRNAVHQSLLKILDALDKDFELLSGTVPERMMILERYLPDEC